MLSDAEAIRELARAITAAAGPGHDALGGPVESLTEAVMGITAGLCRVAEAITDLAEAVRDHDPAGDGRDADPP